MPGHVALEHISFSEDDGRTTVRAHSVFQSVAARDGMTSSGMKRGVTKGYEKLDGLFGAQTPSV